MKNIAVLLSGGTGSRLGGDVPKQYMEVNKKPIIAYSIETIENSGAFDHIQIVCAKEYETLISKLIKGKISYDFSAPGENRQLSIMNALCDMEKKADADAKVFIHDAARPKLSQRTIDDCFKALRGHDGVIPVLPMKDTVYECDESGKISSLLKRERIFAGQAPELFDYHKYLEANRALSFDNIMKIHGSTEPAVMAGMDIVTIPGDEDNYKITTINDFEKFKKEMN